ncbi:immunity 49 family protein [Streptomyces sp. NPDC051907]|uniref:immunity 49 family protein n=1 Tax=Streptomyces sp. NPDC051907 TaxID=3155284 RepID=UPI0034311BDA
MTNASDAHLPMLTVPQAARLRSLTADYFSARRGVRLTVEGAAVEYDGHVNPLTNLAQRCRTVAEEYWPEMVEQHFARLETASQGGENAQEMLRHAYLRLVPDDFTPAPATDGFAYVRPVAEGLVAALALDAPSSVRILHDGDVARVGLEELWAAGRANLLAEPVEHDEVRGPQGALLHSVYGDSHFVSSKALALSDLARSVTGRELPEAGALVVMPTRHLLAFHPIVDGTVVDAVNDLGAYALGAYEDGPGALSPRLYWWHKESLVSLTSIDRETKVFSIVPPPELMELMKSLYSQGTAGQSATGQGAAGQSGADTGRQAQPDASAAPADAEQLAHAVGEFTSRLPQDPSSFGDAFKTALTLGYVRCAADPDSGMLETWEAWVGAMQVGAALFDTTLAQEGAVECRIGDRVLTLPATGPAPYADGRAWLDAFWLALVCRERDRLTRLCQVPLDDLRRASAADDYLFHWIDTLQSYWLRRPMGDVIVPKLLEAMNTSHPDVATRTPSDFLNLIDYQPIALFHRLITNDHEAFAQALTEALDHHERYWSGSIHPRRQVALGPLALACLAHDGDFPIDTTSPYLPKHLISRAWCGEFPT